MSAPRRRWGLRLLALAIALGAWFFATAESRQQRTQTQVLEAFVSYRTASQMTILNSVQKVQVSIRGTERQLQSLNPLQVSVTTDLREAEKGVVEVALGPQNVVLPQGLEVIGIEPSQFTLELDRLQQAIKPVEPNLVGEPAAGAVVLRAEAVPAQVLVRGPESKVSALASVSTSPISLNTHALDFEERAAVVSAEPLVQIVEPASVTVRVSLEIPAVGSAR